MIVEKAEDLQIDLHLTLSEVNLILASLSELPYKVSFSVIQKIRQQGDTQFTAAQGMPSGVMPQLDSPHTKNQE